MASNWPEKRDGWPRNHASASMDRNLADEKALEILKVARQLRDAVGSDKHSRAMLLYGLSVIDGHASDIARLMELNGAPGRPY